MCSMSARVFNFRQPADKCISLAFNCSHVYFAFGFASFSCAFKRIPNAWPELFLLPWLCTTRGAAAAAAAALVVVSVASSSIYKKLLQHLMKSETQSDKQIAKWAQLNKWMNAGQFALCVCVRFGVPLSSNVKGLKPRHCVHFTDTNT